ncbi:hypothetical protein Emag_005964 [Eimeria magna]
MPVEGGKTLEPHQGSRLVQPSEALRRGGGGFRDATVLRNEFCRKSLLSSKLTSKEGAKAVACVSSSGAEEASPRCFFSTAFIEDTEDEEEIPSELQGAPFTPSKQRATAEQRGGGGRVLRVAFDPDSQRREVILLRGSKKSERLREAAASLASPKKYSIPAGASPSTDRAATALSDAHVRQQQQQQLVLQKGASVQVEAGTRDLDSGSSASLRAAAGSCLVPLSQKRQQLQGTSARHPAESLLGQAMNQAPAACGLEEQQPPMGVQEGPTVGEGGPTGRPHCLSAGPSPAQQMHAATPELSAARAAAPASSECNGLTPVTAFSGWAQGQQQQHMQQQHMQQQHMQQHHMQQQHMQGVAGAPAGRFYPPVGQPLWGAPAFSFGQPYWVGCPWVPQRQGPSPPSVWYSGPRPSCLPLGAGLGALSQQVLQRSTSAASSGALRRFSVEGSRRSSTTTSEQLSQGGLQGGGPPRGPPSHEPHELLLSQHLQPMRQQQQKGFSQNGVYGQLGELTIHPEASQKPRHPALSATLPTGGQRSSSCSRLTNRSNCLPPQWGPQGPPGFQPEWGPSDQGHAGGGCYWGPPNPSTETQGGAAPRDREASQASQTQEGAPPSHLAADVVCQEIQNETTDAATLAAAAAGGCPADVAMESCFSAAAAAAGASTETSDRGPLRESPAAIGGRILRRLQTLKDLLEGHDTRKGLAERGAPPTQAPVGPCGAPLELRDACRSRQSNAVHARALEEEPRSDSETCIYPKGALDEGPPAEPLRGKILVEEGPPSCVEQDPVSAAAAEKPESSPGSREGGLSLIAAGVPRLTLAMLNSAGGPGGAGGGGGPSLGLNPRRGLPPSVFQAPRRPASPEPLGERPGRGPLRRQREEGDSNGSSAAIDREATQQGEGRTAQKLNQYSQGHPHATYGDPLKDPYLCVPDDPLERIPRGILGPPSCRGAPPADDEAAGERGCPIRFDAAGAGDRIQETQRAPSPGPVVSFSQTAEEAPGSSEVVGMQQETESWQKPPVSSPAAVSVSRILQQQSVKWALWTGAGISGLGDFEEVVLSAEEASGVHTPGHPKPQHGSVSAYPSLPVAVGGCRSSRLDFFMPIYTAEETRGPGFEPHHHETGLAVCEKEGLRLMVLWEGPRGRPCGIVDPHVQIAVSLLEELHARGDPRRALEAAFEKVFSTLSKAQSRGASAAAALVLRQKGETDVSRAGGGLDSRPLRVFFKHVGSVKALAARQAAESPRRFTFNSGNQADLTIGVFEANAERDALAELFFKERISDVVSSLLAGEVWEIIIESLETAGICLGNASFWETIEEDRIALQLCSHTDSDPQVRQIP